MAQLYDRYAQSIYNVGLRLLGSQPEAEDLVHDVFVGLVDALDSFEGRGSFGGWLNRIATRRALMTLRRMKRRGEITLSEDINHGHEGAVRWSIDRLAIESALAQLPPDLRVVFILKEIEGYSHTEIAEVEEISVTNSRVRFYRARELLRSLLEDSE